MDIDITSYKIGNPANRPDKGNVVTLWNIVRKYVKDRHPRVPIDSENAVSGSYRFRVKVLKNEVEIADAGASPGMDAPENFSRETIHAADPDLFKRISKVCKYRGKGGVVVYRNPPRKLKSNWTMVAAADLQAIHGLDAEKELIDDMVAGIVDEADRAFVHVPKRKRKAKKK